MRHFNMTLKHTIFILTIVFFLASCGAIGGCAFSSADIQNQTNKDIFVVISFDSADKKKSEANLFLRLEGTKLADIVDTDTINYTKTYRIKSKGNLTLYVGPGSDPKLLLKSLKIITDKAITEFKSPDELADALESHNMQNSLIVK